MQHVTDDYNKMLSDGEVACQVRDVLYTGLSYRPQLMKPCANGTNILNLIHSLTSGLNHSLGPSIYSGLPTRDGSKTTCFSPRVLAALQQGYVHLGVFESSLNKKRNEARDTGVCCA